MIFYHYDFLTWNIFLETICYSERSYLGVGIWTGEGYMDRGWCTDREGTGGESMDRCT